MSLQACNNTYQTQLLTSRVRLAVSTRSWDRADVPQDRRCHVHVHVAVSVDWWSHQGVLINRALLLGSIFGTPDFLKLHVLATQQDSLHDLSGTMIFSGPSFHDALGVGVGDLSAVLGPGPLAALSDLLEVLLNLFLLCEQGSEMRVGNIKVGRQANGHTD